MSTDLRPDNVSPNAAHNSAAHENIAPVLAEIETNIRSGRLEVTRATLPQLILPFEDDIHALAAIALALVDRSVFDIADELYCRLLSVAPKDAKVIEGFALSALRQRNWPEACRRWESAVETFPDQPWGYAGLASALMVARRADESQAMLAKAVERFPEDADIACQRAQLASIQKDLKTSIDRWADVRTRFPHRVEGFSSCASVLRDAGRFEDAEALLEGVRSRFGTNFNFMFESAWNATRLARWSEAFRRWNAILVTYPHITSIDTSLGMAITLWRHAEADGDADAISAELPPEIARRAGVTESRHSATEMATPSGGPEPLTDRELMAQFESLGDRCEFGCVQRYFGAEPLGLLRWSQVSVEQLVDLLDCRLEGVGDPENVYVHMHPETDEFFAGDRRFFVMHTFAQKNEVDEETLLPQMGRKMAFLKRKLLKELDSGDRIFVYRKFASDLTDSEADAISSVFTRNFPAGRLLLMRRATDRAKAGSVEPFGLKAMIGYLSNFAHDLKGTPLIMYDEWHSVCVQALALSRSATPEPAAVASCSMPASRSTNALPA